ncbi:MAG: ribosome small subunit-dependent GTPase A [Mycoplasma sp.]
MNNNNGRIIKVIKDDIWVEYQNEIYKTNALGIFRNKNIKPTCGDFVTLNFDDKVPMITNISERKNSLLRPNVCNVDIVVIVQSTIEPDFNPLLLDKMITFYALANCHVVVALTKTDLSYSDSVEKYVSDYKDMDYKIYDINSENEYKEMINNFSGKIVCFVGNSGVGKSTLINRINPELNIRTQEISKSLNRGKHTTTNTTIIKQDDYYVVDTPGYSSIVLTCSQHSLAHNFFGLQLTGRYCQFNDCFHRDNNIGCLISSMIQNGQIKMWRYDNYLHILNSLEKKFD